MNDEKIKKQAKRIRRKWADFFNADIHLMRFGRWKSYYGLCLLAARLKPGSVGVEVGCFAGESATIFMECGVGMLVCVDCWDPDAYRPGRIEAAEASFDRVAEYFPGVKKRKGDSVTEMKSMAAAGLSVDFVYIDGDHSEEGVIRDILAALPLVRPGGLLCGHDYGRKLHPGVTLAVDKIIGKPDEVFPDSSWLKQVF